MAANYGCNIIATLPIKPLKIHLRSGDDNGSKWFYKWFAAWEPANGWLYEAQSEHPTSTTDILNGTLPEVLQKETGICFSDYYTSFQNVERRNDISATAWFDTYFQIKTFPQLRYREFSANLRISPEVKYIANHLPHHLLNVLGLSWSQYHESDPWDNFFQSNEVPILDAENRVPIRETYLPLPELVATVNRLGLQNGFGFLQELGGMTVEDANTWNFLKRFGVSMKEDLGFWLALLKQAQKKDDIYGRVVFEIYSNMQRFAGLKSAELLT